MTKFFGHSRVENFEKVFFWKKMKKELTRKDCLKWKKSTLINPLTKRKLYEGVGNYNIFVNDCKKYDIEVPKLSNINECKEWFRSKKINPKSGRRIKSNSPKIFCIQNIFISNTIS